ncbi:MAG: diheme cytochrome c-553 [Saprospiraceae bacterium]|nr:diheme cytochrome c-553 [Saprospiraceae bacterium]
MKNYVIIALVVVANLSMLLLACNENTQEEVAEVAPTKEQLRLRGEYLVNAIGCDDCHSPKVMGPNGPEVDFSRRFSGHRSDAPIGKIDTKVINDWVLFGPEFTATVGAWGVSFAANITSDETGIGTWTEKQFLKAIREGKSKGLDGTRPLLPPMPWFVYKNLSDEDLRAIFTYLQSTEPVNNVVPAPIPMENIAQ